MNEFHITSSHSIPVLKTNSQLIAGSLDASVPASSNIGGRLRSAGLKNSTTRRIDCRKSFCPRLKANVTSFANEGFELHVSLFFLARPAVRCPLSISAFRRNCIELLVPQHHDWESWLVLWPWSRYPTTSTRRSRSGGTKRS